jgi:hypothetical protein
MKPVVVPFRAGAEHYAPGHQCPVCWRVITPEDRVHHLREIVRRYIERRIAAPSGLARAAGLL